MEKTSKKEHESVKSSAETMSDTIVSVLDRIAGKESDIKLTFQDLEFDTGVFKAKLSGSIILDIVMAKEPEK